MQKPAAEEVTDPEVRRGDPVGARVVVRALSCHWTDTREQAFLRPGALAVREALRCVAQDRESLLIETRVRLLF